MRMNWQTCVDKQPPNKGTGRVASTEINRVNRLSVGEMGNKELASFWNKRWPQGSKLRVRFLDGSPELHEAVARYAALWAPHINLSFQFGNYSQSEIRVSFAREGYWSYVGTDAQELGDDEPTMNFGRWSDQRPDDSIVRRTVLHEFGHALGCVHEHQSPEAGIPWDVEKVLAYYRLTQGWNAQETFEQVLYKYSFSEVRATVWDGDSIMQYPVERFLTDGKFEVPWNSDLSPADILFVGKMYPRTSG